jgi:hypothetical protein
MARETPHALRILNILPIPQIVAGFGLLIFVRKVRASRQLVPILYFLSVFSYLWGYHHFYMRNYSSQWQDGYKQMVEYVTSVESNYDHIYVTSVYGRPYIYFLFYGKVNPEFFWTTAKAYVDPFGFWHVDGFGKFSFTGPTGTGKWLVVKSPNEVSGTDKGHIIYDSNAKPVFTVFEKYL